MLLIGVTRITTNLHSQDVELVLNAEFYDSFGQFIFPIHKQDRKEKLICTSKANHLGVRVGVFKKYSLIHCYTNKESIVVILEKS